MTSLLIRPSREDELGLISALEKGSDAQFRAAGMKGVADAPAPDSRAYGNAHQFGRLLTAVSPDNTLIGFIRIEILDHGPHLE